MTTNKTLRLRQQHIRTLVRVPLFEHVIIGLILLNAAILGLETHAALVASYGDWFELGHQLILAAFIIEALLKISAVPAFQALLW